MRNYMQFLTCCALLSSGGDFRGTCNTVYFLEPFDSWMANKASPIHVLIVELMVEARAC